MARCSECGYLGLRNMLNGCLEEAQEPFIPNSVIKTMAGMTGAARYQLPPICAKGLTRFQNAAEPQLLIEIGMDRQCAGFMQRLAGSTPKEHRQIEMEKFLRDEADQRHKALLDWQATQRNTDLEWRARETERADERHAEQMKQGRSQLIVVGIVGTLAISVATIIGSLIQAGRLFAP